MPYYCTFGSLQNELKSHYRRTGEKIQFVEAINALYKKNMLLEEPSDTSSIFNKTGKTNHENFNDKVDLICFPVIPSIALSESVHEMDMIPELRDVYIIRHPRYTRLYMHRHDYVEIDYVMSGSCKYYFEDEVRILHEGELCLTAPSSLHDVEIDDESTVYCIMLRRGTFQSAFFSLLGNDDALSLFFRALLTEEDRPNYLIFEAEDLERMELLIQDAMMECHYNDIYSNICCINFIHLMFACVLRSSRNSPQFYHYHMGTDFAAILHYIRHNYQTLTLEDLAKHFHYSKPHMCTLIKQNTGTSFTALVRQIRMNRAKDYLIKTSVHISDIAEITGYHSADHFSRVFRSTYGVSPQEYRRMNVSEDSHFIPFETK